ncbi:hypothetical protein [Actinomadura sp. 3N407]|uniref:hypothetical protein n=1 Tax=Actinomadura sp. 3N407 TaxID=3457423 RepID=UPI003FCCD352
MIRNSRRMVTLAVAGAVAIAPVITGCGAGTEAQSAAPTRLTEGVNVSVPKGVPHEQISLRNMFLLGPKPGEPVPPGTSLPLYGVLINQVVGRQDRLVSVSSPLFGSARIDGGGIVLPPAAPDGTGSVTKLLGEASATPGPTAPGRNGRPGTGQPESTPTGAATPEPTGPGATPDTTSSPTSGDTVGPAQSGPPVISGEGQPLVVLNGLNKQLLAGAPVTVRLQFEKAGAVEFQVPLVSQQGDFNTYPLPTPAGRTPASPGAPGGPQPSPGTEPAQPGASASPGGGAQSPGAAGH